MVGAIPYARRFAPVINLARRLPILQLGLVGLAAYKMWLDYNRPKRTYIPGFAPGVTFQEYTIVPPYIPTGRFALYTSAQSSGYQTQTKVKWNAAEGMFPRPWNRASSTVTTVYTDLNEYVRDNGPNHVYAVGLGRLRWSITQHPDPNFEPIIFRGEPLPPRVPAPLEIPSPYPGFSVPAPFPIIRPVRVHVPRPLQPRPIVEVAVDITVNPPGIVVVPNPRPVKPLKGGKRERKMRAGRGVASMIFAAYSIIDDLVDVLQIFVDSMGGPKGSPQENAIFLSDWRNWLNFDPAKYAWGIAEFLAEEFYYGRIEGAMQDRINKLLDSPVLMRDVFGGQTPDREAPVAAFFDFLKQLTGYEE